MSTLSPPRALSTALGYDPELLTGLSAAAQQDLELMSAAWCWTAVALSAPLAYVGWLLTHGAWLCLAAGLGALLMLVQIVRLTVAGAGLSVSASTHVVRGYRPSFTPVLWFALLGAMFAQPAQLPLWQREHGALVSAERSKLLLVHAHARAMLGDPSAASHDGYERELLDNEFTALRLCSLWSSPQRAARYTLLYLLVVLGPLVFTQLYGRRTLCRYQWLRVRKARRIVATDRRRTEQRVFAALLRYASYTPRARDAVRQDAARLCLPWPVTRTDGEASS